MEESRERIVKISKVIQLTANIGLLIFGFFCLLGIGQAVVAGTGYPRMTNAEMAEIYGKIAESANLLPIDLMHSILDFSHVRMQLTVSGICIALTMAILWYCIWEYKKIFKNVINSRTPFTRKTCEDFRKLSVKALPLAFFSTLLGVVVFLVTRLMSYIFEYGTYLQPKRTRPAVSRKR